MTMEIDMAHEISALRARLAEVERERDVYRDDAIRYVGLLAEARDERDAAIADAARLREALEAITEDTPCDHIDHHGVCQTHSMSSAPCAVAQARALLRAKGVG